MIVIRLGEGEPDKLEAGDDVTGDAFELVQITWTDFQTTEDLAWFIRNVVPRLAPPNPNLAEDYHERPDHCAGN